MSSSVFYRDFNSTPLQVVGGDGVYLMMENGRRLLDAVAGAAVVGIGHGRTEIWSALAAAGSTVTYVHGGTFTHPWQEKLASAVISVAPSNMRKVYFSSGGSEANETALKFARQYFVERGLAQKYKVIARRQSFHGATLATLSLSGRTSWKQIYAPMLMPVAHIAPPYPYRCEYCAEKGVCQLSCADDLERAILHEGPETVAAFFAETVVGTTATGLVPDPAYYRRIRDICDKYDILFVADEVLCGYGRVGAPFAIADWNTQADLITIGKGLGSGYAPIAATLVSAKVVNGLSSGSGRLIHGLTYSGLPTACFIGLEVFRIMQEEGLFHRAQTIGAYLRGQIEQIALQFEEIGQIRGKGLLIGVEFVADRVTRQPFAREDDVTVRVAREMLVRGVVVGGGIPFINDGKHGDHIQITPPYTVTHDECDIIVQAFKEALIAIFRK